MSVKLQNYEHFMRKLQKLDADCDEAERNIVNRMIGDGLEMTMSKTNVKTGYLRENWQMNPATKKASGYSGGYSNNVFYGLYVNYGHRQVRNGKTIGYTPGSFFLEQGIEHVRRNTEQYFRQEIKKIKQKGGW